jgi:hypothetical protein
MPNIVIAPAGTGKEDLPTTTPATLEAIEAALRRQFRNAIAHWHPYVEIYEQNGADKLFFRHVLNHPVPGKAFRSLSADDVNPFVEDCVYIRNQLNDLNRDFLSKHRLATNVASRWRIASITFEWCADSVSVRESVPMRFSGTTTSLAKDVTFPQTSRCHSK